MQPGLEGAEGDVEDDCRLGIRQPEVVVDDEHGALFGGQATEASLQLVPHGGQVLGVAVRRACQARSCGSPRPRVA